MENQESKRINTLFSGVKQNIYCSKKAETDEKGKRII